MRTLENCSVIKEALSLGVGRPDQYDGQCDKCFEERPERGAFSIAIKAVIAI